MGPRAKSIVYPGPAPTVLLGAEGAMYRVRQLATLTDRVVEVELPTGVVVMHAGPAASVRTRVAIDASASPDRNKIDTVIRDIAIVGVPVGVEPANAQPKP